MELPRAADHKVVRFHPAPPMRFDEWSRRVMEKELAMQAESDPSPPLDGVAAFIWWLELEAMLNELGITQVNDDE